MSIIPDMSEDEEIRELGGKSTRLEPIDAASDDDEVYDDVAVRNDEEDDEIYQDIEWMCGFDWKFYIQFGIFWNRDVMDIRVFPLL